MKFSDIFGKKPSESAARVQLAAAREAFNRAVDPHMRIALQEDIDQLCVEVAYDDVVAGDQQGNAIEAARVHLKRVGDMLEGRPDADLAVPMIIEVAVGHGAQIYNHGSVIGCAYIYHYAIRIILRCVEGKEGRSAEIGKRFTAVSLQPVTAMNANKRAWEFRHAFDETLERLSAADVPRPVSPASKLRKTVFVSHAELDKPRAEMVVGTLEEAGVGCWIAPRDVTAGQPWAATIMDGIKATDTMLVLLSSHANQSGFMSSEVERAVSYKKRILTARLDDVKPSNELEFFLGPRHWVDLIDGEPRCTGNLQRLIETLRAS